MSSNSEVVAALYWSTHEVHVCLLQKFFHVPPPHYFLSSFSLPPFLTPSLSLFLNFSLPASLYLQPSFPDPTQWCNHHQHWEQCSGRVGVCDVHTSGRRRPSVSSWCTWKCSTGKHSSVLFILYVVYRQWLKNDKWFDVRWHSFIFVEWHHWLHGCWIFYTFICSSDHSHNYCYHRFAYSQCWHFPRTDSSNYHWFYLLRFWSSADFDSLATLHFAVVSMCIASNENYYDWPNTGHFGPLILM